MPRRAQMRDLKLLRDTLTLDEIAGVLAARSNMVVKRKGLQLGDLDFSSLLEAAKLGNLREDGVGAGGGGGPGGGGGSGGKGRRKRPQGKGKPGGKGDASASESDGAASSAGGSAQGDDHDEAEEEEDAAEALAGRAAANGAGPKLFEGDAAARDDSEEADDDAEEDAEEEGEEEEWTLLAHPILGRFFKLLADGKPKADVLAEMAKDAFNPALLDCAPTGAACAPLARAAHVAALAAADRARTRSRVLATRPPPRLCPRRSPRALAQPSSPRASPPSPCPSRTASCCRSTSRC
jgi:hypothetical protein